MFYCPGGVLMLAAVFSRLFPGRFVSWWYMFLSFSFSARRLSHVGLTGPKNSMWFFLVKNRVNKQHHLEFRDLIVLWKCTLVGRGTNSMSAPISICIDTHNFILQIQFCLHWSRTGNKLFLAGRSGQYLIVVGQIVKGSNFFRDVFEPNNNMIGSRQSSTCGKNESAITYLAIIFDARISH